MEILRTYNDGEMEITEYTKDGETVAYSTGRNINLKPTDEIGSKSLPPTLEELQAQTLINTELLVAMAEIGL